MKKLVGVFLSMLLSVSALTCAAAEHGSGALHGSPFGIEGERTENGLTVRAAPQASLIKAEECDFLGILYLELENEEIDIKDAAALREAFSGHPGRIKRCSGMELNLPLDKNMTVIAAPFYRINREPYYLDRLTLGEYSARPWVFRNDGAAEDYAAPDTAEYYDSVGAEIGPKYGGTWDSVTLCYDLDYDLTVPAGEEVTPFIGMYDGDGGLIGVQSPFYRTETPVGGGEKAWLHLSYADNMTVCKSPEPVHCFRAYVWDRNLRPIAASPMTSAAEAELSVGFTEAGADVAVTQKDIRSAVIYGPSKHIFGGCRYLKTLESRDISGNGAVTLNEKGRYLAVLTDFRGVEYKRVIDNF